MGIIIEGEWVEVMVVVIVCFDVMSIDCEWIVISIKIDY